MSTAETLWLLLGAGLRFAQDVGAHRKIAGDTRPLLERELWKRAFWGLVAIDVFVSVFLGRARNLNSEE
jgi:hypothetical protein